MSGIHGGCLGGCNDLTDAQDAFYAEQFKRIQAERRGKPFVLPERPRRRKPKTKPIATADRPDGDS